MRTLLALVLFTVPLAAAPVPKALKKAPASLDGTWEVVEYHSNGNKVNNTVAIKWVIDGQNLSIERNNPRLVGGGLRAPANVSYSLVKPDGGPVNALDYTINFANGVTPTRTMPGVFEFDGESLKFCWANVVNGGERPAKCEPAEGTILYVFKRLTDPR